MRLRYFPRCESTGSNCPDLIVLKGFEPPYKEKLILRAKAELCVAHLRIRSAYCADALYSSSAPVERDVIARCSMLSILRAQISIKPRKAGLRDSSASECLCSHPPDSLPSRLFDIALPTVALPCKLTSMPVLL